MTTTKKEILIIILVGLYLFFIGNSAIAITDPVESNYTLTAAEMLHSGDFISPQIYGSYWYDKPIFFYWELIAAFSAFGINEFAARFFSAIFGIAGLLMTYWFARKIYDAKTGLVAALVLATSFEYWLISKTVVTDMTLFVFFNAILVFFYIAYTTGKTNYYYLCYLFSGLAVLTKGPIGILLPGLVVTVFICCRRDFAAVRQMKAFTGMLIFAVVGGSWYYVMYTLHGNAFIDTFLGVHNVLRATVSEHPRWDVWYYYMGIFVIGFFPWCFTAPMVISKYWKKKQWPTIDTTTLFLLLWAFLINIFYQCMATKYSTYTLPGLLPIAILAARLLLNHEKLFKWMLGINFVFYTALTFFVAIPLCGQYYSAKNVGQAIENVNKQDNIIVEYGDYHTSAVFYGGHTVYSLVHERDLANVEPKEMSWSSKNVMPFIAAEKLPVDKGVYAIIQSDREKNFPKELDIAEWQLVNEFSKLKVYYRAPQE
jgi:4-amino-4-deoxy-L-arabinose transferase-like glycosyltransferase